MEDTHQDLVNASLLGDFLRRDIQYCHLHNYDLTYALYSKFPSWVWREPRRHQRSGCTSLHRLGLSSSFSSSSFASFSIHCFFSFVFSLFCIACYSFRCSPARPTNPVRKCRHSSTADKLSVAKKKPIRLFLQFVPSSELVLFCWWRTKIS